MIKLPALAGALALLLAGQQQAEARTVHAQRAEQRNSLVTYIVTMRRQTWKAQDRAGVHRWPTRYLERHASERFLNYLARMWRQRLRTVPAPQPQLPAHYRDWLCIHRYEASWADDGAPYWGGLQFGYNEWRTYGEPYTHVATANLASPLEQMWAAERYYDVSGFSPWPNTARACGLL